MHLKVKNAAAGLALEQELFEAEGPQVGIWSAIETGIVCPRTLQRRHLFEGAAQTSADLGWPVHIRTTGGGAVPQGPGIDNIALAFNAPSGATLDDGYRILIDIIRRGLGKFGNMLTAGNISGSFCDGAWNLAFGGKKMVGTAQHWRPSRGRTPRVLAHALILTDDLFYAGAEAVASFHKDLELELIDPKLHTSLNMAFGLQALPHEALADSAMNALAFELT